MEKTDAYPHLSPVAEESVSEEPKAPWWKRWLTLGTLVKLGLFTVLVVLVLVAFLVLGVHNKLDDFLEWVEDNKALGFFIFVTVYAVCTVLFIPGLILSLGAGFIFGIPLGALAVWLGATVGQTLAFLLGRYFLRDWIADKTKNVRVWQGIEAAVEQEGWKIVGLLRLAPLIPYNVLNYALGLTGVKFWHYFLASTVGILPGTFLYVVIGNLADDITEITSDDGVDHTTFIITGVVTVVVVVGVVVLTTYYAKRALRKKLNQNQTDEDGTVEGGEAVPLASSQELAEISVDDTSDCKDEQLSPIGIEATSDNKDEQQS